jgi:YHS domain-containing protein
MKTIILTTATIASMLFISCKSAKTESTQATVTAEICIVSGEALGEMGKPVEYTYQGQTLKFCCKSCIAKFEKAPAKYLPKTAAKEGKM